MGNTEVNSKLKYITNTGNPEELLLSPRPSPSCELAHAHTKTHTQDSYRYTYIHTPTHTPTHTNAHTHTHTHTHKHKHLTTHALLIVQLFNAW